MAKNTRTNNKERIEEKSKIDNSDVQSLQIYNWVYVFNTLLRFIGSWLHNSLIYKLLFENKTLTVYLCGLVNFQNILSWVERFKAVALFLGLIFSYFLTERRRDVNWTTTWWLTYSGFSFLFLLSINYLFNKKILGIAYLILAISLSDILYGFLMGIRDGQRPRAFAFLARRLTSHSVAMSDHVKSLLDSRKINTTIAEMVGMYLFLFLIKEYNLNLDSTMLLQIILICSVVNFVCTYYFYNFHKNLLLNDSFMSPAESKRFPEEVKDWLLGLFGQLKHLTFSNLSSFFKQTLNFNNRNVHSTYKKYLFISNFIILKCLFCFSKSNFFQIAATCTNYIPYWEKYARSILFFILIYDLSKSFYRKRTGKHLIKSLDMLGLGTVLTLLSKIMVWFGQYSNDARPIIFLAYPFYIFAQGLIVQALNHLFEVWGLEKDNNKKDDKESESVALISLKYNALSIGSHVIGKFLNNPFLQLILSLVSIIFNLRLRSIASEAELI